ncbi:AIPR family protein [Aquirufa sp. 5-AUSEE-100C1]
MNKELEITKGILFSEYYNLYKISRNENFIEDCKFLRFMDLLYNSEIIRYPPVVSRFSGSINGKKWGILGNSIFHFIINDDDSSSSDDIPEEVTNVSLIPNFHVSIITGSFSNSLEIEFIKKDEILDLIQQAKNFIINALEGYYIKDLNEGRDLQEKINKFFKEKTLDKIEIIFITDKLIESNNLENKFSLNDYNLSGRIYYWDLKKYNDQKRSKSKRIPININFESTDYENYNVSFIKQEQGELNYILAIFPGDLLAELYDDKNTQLLENNVRVFLSANRKANKAIRNTIKEYPENFFSFNNGISATASNVVIKDGRISEIQDFQIVNGGQTTATIHYAKTRDGLSLSNVFVQVKITSINSNDTNYAKIVAEISKAANTQTSIRESDFYSNDSLLINIERLSNKIPAQDKDGKFVFYFFERMAGQYSVSKNSQGLMIKSWENSRPKEFVFNKIDVARWYNCISQKPHIAALSAEKQFTIFMDSEDRLSNLNESQYKDLIGFGILFKRARKLCGTKTNRDYPSIIADSSVGMATTIYAMSYLEHITNGLIDYHKIYDLNYKVAGSLLKSDKRINSDLDKILEHFIKQTWKQIATFGNTSAQEQTKKTECWEYVKDNIKIDDSIIQSLKPFMLSSKREDNVKTEEEQFFEIITFLLKDEAQKLNSIHQYVNIDNQYSNYRTAVKNLITRIREGISIISLTKLNEIYKLGRELEKRGLDLNSTKNDLDFKNLDYHLIHKYFFLDKEKCYLNLYTLISEKYNSDKLNEEKFIRELNTCKDIIEKFQLNMAGITINDLSFLNHFLKDLGITK